MSFAPHFRNIALTLLLAAVLGSAPMPARAQDSRCLSQSWRNLLEAPHDSPVELELDTSEEVLKLLTTTTGTVEPLLTEVVMPEWLHELRAKHFPKLASAKQIPWDRLSYGQQLELLKDYSRARTVKFGEDRSVPALRVRRSIRKRFSKPAEYLGKTYPAGAHDIDLGEFLEETVEFASPEDMQDFGGVEIKVRLKNGTAGHASNLAWEFLRSHRIPRTHQHVHIISEFPLQHAKNSLLDAVQLADFVRRANLAAEMISLVEDGTPIAAPRWKGTTQEFGTLSERMLLRLVAYFGRPMFYERENNAATNFKIAYVGVRGRGKYSDGSLWGLEVRSIGKNTAPATARAFLDALQARMVSRDYGLPRERIERWLDRRPDPYWVPNDLGALVALRDWPDMVSRLPKHLEQFKPWLKNIETESALLKQHQEIKMLIHDWSKDPLVSDVPGFAELVAFQQARGMRRLEAGEPPLAVVQEFLRASKLYETVRQSIGMK